MGRRIAISKKSRFEVFKRDSFKCQYCGATAPDVLLHVDHINPVSKGGTNDITNLVTACQSCNLGKGARTLDDNSSISKSRNQMELLQERREQLEMMMDWHTGLRDLKDEEVSKLADYWSNYTIGFKLNNDGQKDVKDWLKNFSFQEVIEAMDISAEQYLEFDTQGNCTSESFNIGFNKIAGIMRIRKNEQDKPSLKDIYYIRGIIKNRCNYYQPDQALRRLKEVHGFGESIEDIKEMALSVRNWTQFTDWFIDKQKEYLGENVEIHY
jgi:hypothetical protein